MGAPNVTKHAVLRMSQGGFRIDDLDLIELIATEVEGGYLVLRKDVEAFERLLKQLREQVRRLAGTRIVRDGDTVVTAYHAKRAKERRLLRRA